MTLGGKKEENKPANQMETYNSLCVSSPQHATCDMTRPLPAPQHSSALMTPPTGYSPPVFITTQTTMDPILNAGQKNYRINAYILYISYIYIFLSSLGINVDWEGKGRERESSQLIHSKYEKKKKNNV